jgi:hypothetical protein
VLRGEKPAYNRLDCGSTIAAYANPSGQRGKALCG